MTTLDPDLLLRAYAVGVFPMADSRDAPDVFWVEPKRRGILPLNSFHLSHSLAKALKSDRFTVTADKAFADVMRGCAEPKPDRPETWINELIIEGYEKLFARGHAHSVECWLNGELAGGLYGVTLGGAFFGESMFTRRTNASKVAMAWLVARLRVGGFKLLDTQFLTPHLASMGTIEVPRNAYQSLLSEAVATPADFGALDSLEAPAGAAGGGDAAGSGALSGKRIAQLLTQTS
ncbi:leucyl/phenylalanyl-tRNA--protein transferase [Tardibacter chloracetimidivorans]|uniref:Leucyl/phenylalanyl-tRNA--protein transferase n=1 Tax=Tardibacter chloracetimidivorans TaxID=1921510 RepID=A0A1L3ZYF9_9SPHN|nr:leucyl/phenylalanyl-tRNA--protein transferase [Tardibacter chloracetimidivorans]API60674.1 leucyl/phenylalanyl-tRNA--protein transferase [Tardibacter chloracetimidivorans]